jgi:hypothetical protein
MTNHNELDKVIDSLLAEQGTATDDRAPLAAKPQHDHWLRRTLKTGPVPLPPPSRR